MYISIYIYIIYIYIKKSLRRFWSVVQKEEQKIKWKNRGDAWEDSDISGIALCQGLTFVYCVNEFTTWNKPGPWLAETSVALKLGQRSNARNSAQREWIQGREEKGEIERKKRRKGKRKGRKEKERHESNKKIAGTKLVQVNKWQINTLMGKDLNETFIPKGWRQPARREKDTRERRKKKERKERRKGKRKGRKEKERQ